VPGEPDVGVRIYLGDVSVDLLRGVVIPVFVPECFGHARRVASICGGLALADCLPTVVTALTTAAAEEEIIVDLIVRSRLRAVKHRRRCAFNAYDDRPVLCIRKDMTA
jgi:hypothetical protein